MSKLDEEIRETRLYVALRAHFRCEECNKSLPLDKGEMAHCIAKTDEWITKYGKEVINHPDNLKWTCSGACNDAQNIGNNPVAREALVHEIRMHIYADAAARIEISPHLYTDLINKLAKVARGAT